MAHPQQHQFVSLVSKRLSNDYSGKHILEIGSYDVNGSIRQFFYNSNYLGVDLTAGPGVDILCEGDKLDHPNGTYDLTISSECFEHNPQWSETFLNMYRMTKNGGVLIITCATTGRLEHGTTRTSPKSSPGTQSLGWDYYLNLTEQNFREKLSIDDLFRSHFFLINKYSDDLYFVGIKTGGALAFDFDINLLKQECLAAIKKNQVSSSYSKSFYFIQRITQLPIRIFRNLPDYQYQNIALIYSKILSPIKIPAKYIINKIFK